MKFLGLNVVYLLSFFIGIVLIAPANAQNVSNDEIDIMVSRLIEECKQKVMEDNSVTEAAKTIAKRNCETEITNKYKNIEINYKKQSEIKIQLQKIQNCEYWYPQYQFLTEEQFRLQKNSESVTVCLMLYNDPVWKYTGTDRLEKLVEKLNEIKSELPKPPETRYLTLDADISNSEPKTLDTQETSKIDALEERIRTLEETLSKKDQIIREQLKVITDLASRIKGVMFGGFESFLTQFIII